MNGSKSHMTRSRSMSQVLETCRSQMHHTYGLQGRHFITRKSGVRDPTQYSDMRRVIDYGCDKQSPSLGGTAGHL